jgi:hypothetical protein
MLNPLPVKGDVIYLKATPQFYFPAGTAINGFYRNGASPGDTITNETIPDNYNDCTYLGVSQIVDGRHYLFVRFNFTYVKHGVFGFGKQERSSQDLWFRQEDISLSHMDTKAEIKQQQKEALQKELLTDSAAATLTAANGDASAGSGKGVLYAAIAGIVILSGGVLFWVFGKKSKTPTTSVPTLIQLPKAA